MQQKVYVDTSSLILLTNINELILLKLVYGTVYITIPILEEFKLKITSQTVRAHFFYTKVAAHIVKKSSSRAGLKSFTWLRY